MKTKYANQKAITINRNLPQKGSGKKFLTAYYENITKASRLLSGDIAFKLYLYLLSNQDKYTDDFSPQNFANEFGVSADRCRKVFSQLEEVGYLVRCGSNEYQFYEEPQKKITISLGEQERRYIPTDVGEILMTYAEVYNELKDECAPDYISNFWNNCRKEEEN